MGAQGPDAASTEEIAEEDVNARRRITSPTATELAFLDKQIFGIFKSAS